MSSGVRAEDSWREGKSTLDSDYYPMYPISSFYGVDSGGYSYFIGEKMGLGERRAQSHTGAISQSWDLSWACCQEAPLPPACPFTTEGSLC